jgi:hypothetical protein
MSNVVGVLLLVAHDKSKSIVLPVFVTTFAQEELVAVVKENSPVGGGLTISISQVVLCLVVDIGFAMVGVLPVKSRLY